MISSAFSFFRSPCGFRCVQEIRAYTVYHEDYATRKQARHSIFEYMEVFYNRMRIHSSIGYVSPEAFEAALN